MPLYDFFPTRQDGLSTTWLTRQLPSDAAAFSHAAVVLSDHKSAVRVTIMEGDRTVADLPGLVLGSLGKQLV